VKNNIEIETETFNNGRIVKIVQKLLVQRSRHENDFQGGMLGNHKFQHGQQKIAQFVSFAHFILERSRDIFECGITYFGS